MLDFGARLLDPQIGRWHSVDPLSEISRKYSPFVFGNNNPLRFIDPDGMLARELKGKTTSELIENAWDQTENGTNSSWTNIQVGFVNQEDYAKIEEHAQGLISNNKFEEALRYLTSNISALTKWANWNDITDVNGDIKGTPYLFMTFRDRNKSGKSKLSINPTALKSYNGSSKAYSISGLIFDLNHEFYHVNVIAGNFGLKEIGGWEKSGINPQEEFLASYHAAMANLPVDKVYENDNRRRSVWVVNYLLNYSINPSEYINKYKAQIVELLNRVDKQFQQETIQNIFNATGLKIKLQ